MAPEPDDRHRPVDCVLPCTHDPSLHPGDATARVASSLQPLHDGAHAAASAGGGPVDMYARPAAFLPVVWCLSSSPRGDGEALRLDSGEPVLATVVSASAIVITAGAAVATSLLSSTYGNTYYIAAEDAAAAPGYDDAVSSSIVAPVAAPPPIPTYLYLFYGDAAVDGTIRTLPITSSMSLAIGPSAAVPGSPAGEWAGYATQILLALAYHILAATESTRLGVPVDLAAQDDRIEDEADQEVSETCALCTERGSSWFVPCCGTALCGDCRLHSPVQCGCGIGIRPVPIPPLFTTSDSQPIPRTFVQLRRPLWQIYRYLPGPDFVLISFYNTASAYLRPDLGVRLQTHIYRREGENGWAWRVEFSVEIPPVDPLHIFWRVVLAPHYAAAMG